MNKALPWLMILALVTAFNACTRTAEDIKTGTPKNEVVNTLGKPTAFKKVPFTPSGPSQQIKVVTVFSVDSILAQDMPSDEIWILEYQTNKDETTSIMLREGKVFSVKKEGGEK